MGPGLCQRPHLKLSPFTTPYAHTFRLDESSFLTVHVVTFPNGCADFFSQYQTQIRGVKPGAADTAKMGIQPDPSISK